MAGFTYFLYRFFVEQHTFRNFVAQIGKNWMYETNADLYHIVHGFVGDGIAIYG